LVIGVQEITKSLAHTQISQRRSSNRVRTFAIFGPPISGNNYGIMLVVAYSLQNCNHTLARAAAMRTWPERRRKQLLPDQQQALLSPVARERHIELPTAQFGTRAVE